MGFFVTYFYLFIELANIGIGESDGNAYEVRASTKRRYNYLPQHFLNLRPLPHGQGSLRPTFGSARVIGAAGGQQVSRWQQDSLLFVADLFCSVIVSSSCYLLYF
ncbi:MAG: hypothetical protein P1U52_12855 [Porticoccaceae bacterium]|nr:hypothetical protein [Porticoccaceae bacterium]